MVGVVAAQLGLRAANRIEASFTFKKEEGVADITSSGHFLVFTGSCCRWGEKDL